MPPLAAVPDLEHELDILYGLPLEEFTKARNDLSTRLRKAHQAEAAELVRALKKPSVTAWTANRLARDYAKLVAVLLEAGTRLRDVQQAALAGTSSQDEVGDAAANERDAVRALVAAARSELGPRATPQLLDRLAQTFRAAAIEPEHARTLAAGRLTEELQAVGFGPLEAVAPRRRKPTVDRRAEQARLQELQRLADEARDAEQAARDAERQAARLREAADRAAAALADAQSSA